MLSFLTIGANAEKLQPMSQYAPPSHMNDTVANQIRRQVHQIVDPAAPNTEQMVVLLGLTVEPHFPTTLQPRYETLTG